MGKYDRYQRDQSFEDRKEDQQAHPIWRGFGFIWMVGIPVFSYFLGVALLQENMRRNWVIIPSEYLIRFQDPYILIKIGLTLLLSLLLFAIISFVGVVFFQVGGHRRYGPLDAPPERRRVRKKF